MRFGVTTPLPKPMPTELEPRGALHLAAVLWREMSRSDLVMATHDAAVGLAPRTHSFAVVGIPHDAERSSRRRRNGYGGPSWAMTARWGLCWSYASRRVGDFSNQSANCASVRDRGVGGSNPLAPTTFSLANSRCSVWLAGRFHPKNTAEPSARKPEFARAD